MCQTKLSVGPILIPDAFCPEGLLQIMFMTLDCILVVAKCLITASKVAKCSTFFQVIVLRVGKRRSIFKGCQLLLEVTFFGKIFILMKDTSKTMF
jgi:hypothetical protein